MVIVFEQPVENDIESHNITDIVVDRYDAIKGRLRTASPSNNEDIVIDLPRGRTISHNDIFGPSPSGQYYRIVIKPETTVKVTLQHLGEPIDSQNKLKLGYHIGNRHLEALVENDALYIPATIGIDTIKQVLANTNLPVRLEIVQKIISPDS